MQSIMISLGITLVVILILSFSYKNKKKVDKGFVFNYYKLSYRRKMIRTLTLLPLMIGAVIIIFYYSDNSFVVNLLIGIALFVLFVIQFFYNYVKWKKYEQ